MHAWDVQADLGPEPPAFLWLLALQSVALLLCHCGWASRGFRRRINGAVFVTREATVWVCIYVWSIGCSLHFPSGY